MKVHGLLLQRDGEQREERRHDGRVAVDQRNTRWCSDGLEIACDNGEKVRVAFAVDCCDREAMGHVATTGGITAEDVQDLMVATVKHRFGPVNRLPEPIEWLSDNPVLSLSKGAVATPLATPAPSPATSAWCPAPPPSAARNPTAWPRHSSEPSSATTFASAPDPTRRP
jgi:putative transposase